MEDTQQSVWNIDGAELYAIFGIKEKIIEDFQTWKLEGVYWGIRDLRREVDAKMKRSVAKAVEEIEKEKGKGKKKSEKELLDEWIEEIDKARKKFNSSNQDDAAKVEFYLILEKVYMNICYTMKRHGLYFREGEDATFAVLRR